MIKQNFALSGEIKSPNKIFISKSITKCDKQIKTKLKISSRKYKLEIKKTNL